MSSNQPVTRPLPHGAAPGRARPIADRARVRASVLVLTVLALVLMLAAPARAAAGAEDDWVGKRVVPRARDFVLRLDDEPVEPSRAAIAIYRVERADGPLLWLQAEGLRLSGEARAEDVIPVERAVSFFDERARAHPEDSFAHATRGLVRADRGEFDAAVHDFDQAIRLDPGNGRLYSHRAGARYHQRAFDAAIADFGEAIRLAGTACAHARDGRGMAWAGKGDYDKAIEDYSEAIWLDPLCISAYRHRGLAWYAKKEFAKAIVDDNVVIRLDPRSAPAFRERGNAWEALEAHAKALADFDEAIRTDPNEALALEGRARIQATCPVARYRDGPKAVEAATRACELTAWKNAVCLSTLAAAHAEAGDFDAAAKWQARANALFRSPEDQARGAARLELYREKKPYHEPGH